MTSRVQTVHGTYLVPHKRGVLSHTNNSGIAEAAYIRAFMCPDTPHIILEGARGTEFSLTAGSPRSHTHVAKVLETGPNRFAILDAWTRTYLSARPDHPSGGAIDGQATASEHEQFTLQNPDDLPKRLWDILPLLAQSRITADDILGLIALKDRQCTDRVISAVLPLMSLAEMQRLGQALLDSPALCDPLSRIFKTDLWINRALPLLQDWHRTKTKPAPTQRKRSIDQSLDPLSDVGRRRVNEGTGHTLVTAARQCVPPRRRACIVATARNEGIYLLEWVAYHRALGFDEIVIYSNNNTDQSDVLLSALADAGKIIWYDNILHPSRVAQNKAYSHALTMMPDILDFEWSAFIDIDKFIHVDPAKFSGLGDFLDWHAACDTDAIALNWVYFGSSGARHWADAPITHRLTTRQTTPNAHIKTIFKPRNVISSQPHFPCETERLRLRFRESNGAKHSSRNSAADPSLAKAFSDDPTDSHAFVAHYFHKSCEEFLWKFSRNRGDYEITQDDISLSLEPRFLKSFLSEFDTPGTQQNLATSNPEFQAEQDALLNIPAVAQAAATVKATFQERSQRVMERYRAVLINDMGDDGKRFVALLDTPVQTKA